MTRTGTLVVFRWVIAATLAATTSISTAENLPSLSRGGAADDGWTVSGNAEENPFRGGVNAAVWQPTRAANQPAPRPKSAQPVANAAPTTNKSTPTVAAAPKAAPTPAPAAPPKLWLAPNSQATREPNAANMPAQARAPKSFTPPQNAQPLGRTAARSAQAAPSSSIEVTAQDAVRPAAQQAQTASKNPQRGNSLYTGSAAVAKSSAPNGEKKVEAATTARHPNPNPVSHRPRPTPVTSKSFFGVEDWVGPLRQVAYQASGGEEEMPVPPGQRSMMRGGPNVSRGQNMPESYYPDDEQYFDPGGMPSEGWIGPPPGGCSDGTCGPDGCCGPMCGDSCEPGCGCSRCGPQDDLLCVGPGDDESCHTVRIRVPKCQEIVVFGGVHGFKGPFDQDRNSGNFGFQEGINFGAKVPFTDWGYQVGYEAAQSQLSGDANTGIADPFSQHFWTTGLFHRTRDGIQGGVVWDLLLDSRNTTTDFHQIRGEISYVECGCHEFGFMGSFHVADEVLFDNEEETRNAWQATDQYLLFYRMHGATGGEGRLFAGISDDSDAIIGADFLLPLKSHWSLQTGFTYLIPEEPAGETAARQEAWNLGINLVWHWGGRARKSHSNPYRPLFNVADNGSMIIDDRP